MRMAFKSVAFLAAILVATPVSALNVQLFHPSPHDTGVVTIPSSDTVPKGKLRPSLFVNFVRNPLEFGLIGSDPRIDQVVDWFLTTDLLLSVGVTKNFSLGINIPVIFTSEIEPIVSEVGDDHMFLGDPVLTAKWRLRTNRHEGLNRVGIALIPFMTIPASDTNRFFGDTNVTGGFRMVVDRPIASRHYLTMNLGLRFRERERILNLNVNHEVLAGLGYGIRILKEKKLDLFTEVYGSTTTANFLSEEVSSPLELVLGLKKSWNRWQLALGGGRGLNNGYGAPDWRVFAGVTYAPAVEVTLAPPVQAAPAPTPVATPLPKAKVAPPPSPVLTIPALSFGKILFETNRAVIQPASFVTLDHVVKVLAAHPEVKRVRIEAHTDSQGKAEYNLLLSERRAKSVRAYLEKKEIDPSRLESKGYGESRPIETNSSIEGRRANRRVEFTIVKP